ncbi:MAG: SDR family oxidoreductase [Campylobacterales bacterium]
MRRRVLVTGSSRGIGLAICQLLHRKGYEVIGVSRKSSRYTNVIADLRRREEIERVAGEVGEVDILINNAGVGYFGNLENLSLDQIGEMVAINFLAPLLLTRLLLPGLIRRKGHIINIGSVSGVEKARLGSVYGATKAGLHHFSRSLFEEVRRRGVKVTTIIPDMTLTSFYQSAFFAPAREEGRHLNSWDIAQVVLDVLEAPSHLVCTQLIIQPQMLGIEKKRPK